MPSMTDPKLIEALSETLQPLTGDEDDYDRIMDLVGDARFVLIGEASHGTHDFYRERAEITKRLIEDKGFVAVAVEADWPDAYRLNRYVRRLTDDVDAIEALADFKRFPTWMWRNTVIVEFVEWLRARNDTLGPGAQKAGFAGGHFSAGARFSRRVQCTGYSFWLLQPDFSLRRGEIRSPSRRIRR